MRRLSFVFGLVGAVGLAGLLSACGSSDSPSASAGAGGAGGSGSASASGTVTGFGSLLVNGKRFETNNVLVRVDDSRETPCTIGPPSPPLDHSCGLKKGMVVTVNGSFNGEQRIAASVRQKDAVEGLVQSVAADGLSLVVMGQTVLVDSATIFDGNFTPVAGDNVEVNGHIQPGGIIQATFIEKKLPPVTPEVRGFVTGHNDGTKTFKIGNLTVDYSTTPPAGLSDMPPPNRINWDGRFVEVKGGVGSFTPGPDPLTEGTLIASKVEPENRGVGNDDDVDEFEVEGFVTNVISVDINTRVAHFFIGTTEVRTTSNTEFRGGSVDEIVLGAKMSAEGRLENGVLIAEHVKFKESVRLEGNIVSINPDNNTFQISIGLPNLVTVTVNRLTDFKATGGVRITGLSGLGVGNHVRVRGRVTSNNTVIATRIQLRSLTPDDDVTLQGPVQVVRDPDLTILGVTVDTTGVVEFEGIHDEPISRAAFFSAVREGTLVKVKGRLVNGTVQWREASLED